MMRSRVRALRSMISRARVGLGGIGSALPKQAEPHQDRSQRRPQLVGEQRQELVLEAARVHRSMPRGLLPLQERGDVADDPAAVDEPAVPKEAVRPDQHSPDGAVLGPQAAPRSRSPSPRGRAGRGCRRRPAGSTRNSAMEWPTHSCSAHPSSSSSVLFVQSMRPSGIHPAQADRGVLEELDELLVALGRPRAVGRPVAHQLRRAARLATTVISSAGCTGLDRCSWKPARSARRRSSVRA